MPHDLSPPRVGSGREKCPGDNMSNLLPPTAARRSSRPAWSTRRAMRSRTRAARAAASARSPRPPGSGGASTSSTTRSARRATRGAGRCPSTHAARRRRRRRRTLRSAAASTRTSATARLSPFAPVGGTMCAASPARNSRPCCIGSTTNERIGVTPFSTIGPASRSSARRVRSSVPDAVVGPVVRVGVRLALEVEAAERRRAHAVQREPALVAGVDELLGRRRDLRQDAEPGERIRRARTPSARPRGIDGRQTPWKPSQPAITSQRSSCASPPWVKRIAGRSLSRSSTRTSSASNSGSAPAASRAREQVLDDLLLAVHRDAAAAGQLGEVDPVPAPGEAQLDAVVHEPLALHPVAEPALDQQVDRALLEHAGADALLQVRAAAHLEHHRLDALLVEQVREQQPGRPGPHDARPACACQT